MIRAHQHSPYDLARFPGGAASAPDVRQAALHKIAIVALAAASVAVAAGPSGAAAPDAPASVFQTTAGPAPGYPLLVRLFDYDRNAPLEARESEGQVSSGVRVLNVSFKSPKLGRVTGYLVLPDTAGPFPAIVWMPGLDGRKDAFLSEAIDLARVGAAGLLLDSVLVRPPFPRLFNYDARARELDPQRRRPAAGTRLPVVPARDRR